MTQADIRHGLRLAAAAILAFAVASLLHIDNAYWAAMPVWVVSQSTRGLMIERGLFRIAGTIIGAAFGFALMWLALPAAVTLALLGCWIGCNGFLAQTLRGVHGYGLLLSGMTAAVVVLPSVLAPEHAAALAAARVECTLIGVLCVTVLTSAWTPTAMRQAFYDRVHGLARQVRDIAGVGTHDTGHAEIPAALREMAKLQAEAGAVSAGSIQAYRRLHQVDAVIVACLAVLARARALDYAQRVHPTSQPDNVAQVANGEHRAHLQRALKQLMQAEQALGAEQPEGRRSLRARFIHLAPHRDIRLAAETGVIAGMATFAVGLLAHWSGWGSGELTALGVCIFSMVLGSMPSPRVIAPVMLRGVSVGVAVATVFRLLIQPHIDNPVLLILVMAPFLIVGGLARANPRTAGPALDANMCFLLGSQAVLPPVTAISDILSGAVALLLAVGIVAPAFMVIPSGSRRHAASAISAIRADLLRLVRSARLYDQGIVRRRTERQVLRLSLHLEQHLDETVGRQADPLSALVLGNAIAWLIEHRDASAASSDTGRAAAHSLAELGTMVDDPDNAAARLDAVAGAITAAIPRTAALIRETASALRSAAPMLRQG